MLISYIGPLAHIAVKLKSGWILDNQYYSILVYKHSIFHSTIRDLNFFLKNLENFLENWIPASYIDKVSLADLSVNSQLI